MSDSSQMYTRNAQGEGSVAVAPRNSMEIKAKRATSAELNVRRVVNCSRFSEAPATEPPAMASQIHFAEHHARPRQLNPNDLLSALVLQQPSDY